MKVQFIIRLGLISLFVLWTGAANAATVLNTFDTGYYRHWIDIAADGTKTTNISEHWSTGSTGVHQSNLVGNEGFPFFADITEEPIGLLTSLL